MNQDSTALWSPMVSGPEDEFSNFLDFNDFNQLHFPPFGSGAHEGGELPYEQHATMDVSVGNEMDTVTFKEGDIEQQIDPRLMQQDAMADLSDMHGSTESLMEPNTQSHMYHQCQEGNHRQHQVERQYQRRGMVPPTPNSIEMNANHIRYHAQVDPYMQSVYGKRNQKQQDVSNSSGTI